MKEMLPARIIAQRLGISKQAVGEILNRAKEKHVKIPTKMKKVKYMLERNELIKHIDFEAFKRFRDAKTNKRGGS